MFHLPEHFHNLSLRLSEVLNELGVNERMVKNMRRSGILLETLLSLLSGRSCYIFGSQSEGTTTIGLDSDTDLLTSLPKCNVIQDYAEWKHGVTNLLMIKDDATSPGYCYLQLIRDDMPLPVTEIIDQHCIRDADGRILWKNTVFDDRPQNCLKNGPAWTYKIPGFSTTDGVTAISCESWPTEAREWSQRCLEKWPTEEMKRYVENSGCFVVPVGSKLTQIETLEWRISTSKAERCQMFNLNITQIRCVVLLKMILKTYLNHPEDPVSSYMCKTVLLRCIEKTHNNMWKENNLFTCLTVCLQELYDCILHESCPHYFIPGNNLMARKFSPKIKAKLLKSVHHLSESQGVALFGIQIDDLGERLKIKMNPLYQSVQTAHLLSADDISLEISGNMVLNVAYELSRLYLNFTIKGDIYIRNPLIFSKVIMRLISYYLRLYKKGTKTERKPLQLLVPFYCSSLGSVLASVNIGRNHTVSTEALNWLSAGLNSDVSSGRLKLASVLHCAGNMLRAESILRETEKLYHLDSVESICCCYYFAKGRRKTKVDTVCYIQNVKAISSASAFCVKFFPAEMNCIPHELQYELFRSTDVEWLHRYVFDLFWMEMAVVDSLPFLYFLQYKTYGDLQRYNDQQRALQHLELTVNLEEDFGHRETTLNLLGQCYEQENRLNEALACYTRSLAVRGSNNVAKIHICRLLADKVRQTNL